MSTLPCVEIEPAKPADAAVIWLHGLGADGNDFVPVVKELGLPAASAIRFVFPHAPQIPVTINNGYVMPAWYDIFEMSLARRIDTVQLEASAAEVDKLIAREIERGVPSERIVLAGFSQGGAVVYQAALASEKPLAGLLVLSSYFASADTIVLAEANRKLPVLVQHGVQDPVVAEVLGQTAVQRLKTQGYAVEYQQFPMEHSVCAPQIVAISQWLQRVLPPL